MSPAHPSPTTALPGRARLAVATGRAVSGASKLVHFGSGSVIGGRAALLVDRDLLARLSVGREVVIVSATNGKTTTTRLIGAALGTDRPVVSNSLGANMAPGIVAALGVADPSATAVLEVDERWVAPVLADTGAGTVVLLNLSRDQLDRTQEVRKLAERWRAALTATPPARVVANADDPLVVWAASAAPEVVWVATGQDWTSDAAGCPRCSGRIAFEPGAWHCTDCDLTRPEPDVTLDDTGVVLPSGRVDLDLDLPGRVNRVNAAFALAAVAGLGADLGEGRRRHRGRPRGRRSLPGRDPRRAPGAPAAGQEPGRLARGPRPHRPCAGPGGRGDQRPHRRRARPLLVVGRRLRTPRRPSGGRDRRTSPRPRRAAPLRRGRARHRRRRHRRRAPGGGGAGPPAGGVIDVAANYTAFQEYLDLVGGPG